MSPTVTVAALGAVRDATGSFVPVIWLLLASAAAFAALAAAHSQ